MVASFIALESLGFEGRDTLDDPEYPYPIIKGPKWGETCAESPFLFSLCDLQSGLVVSVRSLTSILVEPSFYSEKSRVGGAISVSMTHQSHVAMFSSIFLQGQNRNELTSAPR